MGDIMFGFQNINLFSTFNTNPFNSVNFVDSTFNTMPLFSFADCNIDSNYEFYSQLLRDANQRAKEIEDYNNQLFNSLIYSNSNTSDKSVITVQNKKNEKINNKNNNNFRPYNYNNYANNADKIRLLDPQMQEKTMLLLDYAKSVGLEVTISSGYRTKERQAQLCKEKPHLAAKNSLHCQGKAIDISIKNGTDSDYKKLADYAKTIGLRWGGDFKNFTRERWHFDMGA